jgi:glyoxylase-like metal-dependent hydrolase (beta-lactamase superfamily II)
LETGSSFVPGVPVSLGPTVRRIVAPNAGLMTGAGTNTYLLGNDEIAVLDPGPDDAAHLQAILAAVAPGRVRWVVVTHTHRDHSPLAMRLATLTGATAIGLGAPDDGRQDETFRPQRLPYDGERLELGGLSLTAVHTPGHASNCVCYLLDGESLLFTGDHVLQGVSPVILPPDGDMSAYLHSLKKLENYAFERMAPGHGGVMDQPRRIIEALVRHRLAREAKALRALGALGASTLEGLTPVVYDDVTVERHGWARLTLQAHLIKLLRDGRVSERAGSWQIAP